MRSDGDDLAAVQAAVDATLAATLRATGAQRLTVRLDVAGLDFPCLGEVVEDGQPRMFGGDTLGHRAAPTGQWLIAHRVPLVQPSFAGAGPLPPQGLRDDFGVRAQVLAPLVRDDTTIGWVSCHSTRERAWSDDDVAAVASAAADLVARGGDLERLAAARFGP